MTKKIGTVVAGVAAVLAIMVPAAVLDGWAFSVLWRWFAVPQFQVAPFGVAEGVGLGTMVALVSISTAAKTEEKLSTVLAHQFAAPFFAIAIGWVALHFVR